ncbi:MAG: hypothetical protein J5875_08660 [Paludibacteraceae bacterium]|nr:hypothetical protein [Paludibacteraceae bacterium]
MEVYLREKRDDMLTKEEITSIVCYCKEKKVSYSSRLKELSIPEWKFYAYKARYSKEQSAVGGIGEFIQLEPNGNYVQSPSLIATRGAVSSVCANTEKLEMSVRCANGNEFTIFGICDAELLQSAIKAILGNV